MADFNISTGGNNEVKVSSPVQTIKAQFGQNVLKFDTKSNSVQAKYDTNVLSANIVSNVLVLGETRTVIREAGSASPSISYTYVTDSLSDPTGRFIYHGKAADGTAFSAPMWRIYRIDTAIQPNPVTAKATNGTFTHKWDDRLTITYN